MTNIWARLAATEDRLKRRLLFIGWLSEELRAHHIRPIVVGGNALEFYTLGEYATLDIDLVAPEREVIGQILEKAGFQREGRHWYRADIEIAVEIPCETLAGSYQRVESVDVEGYTIHIIGKEDLLIDRLNACVYWRSSEDCRWTKELMVLYYHDLDWTYLEERARTEGTLAKLGELRQEVERLLDDQL